MKKHITPITEREIKCLLTEATSKLTEKCSEIFNELSLKYTNIITNINNITTNPNKLKVVKYEFTEDNFNDKLQVILSYGNGIGSTELIGLFDDFLEEIRLLELCYKQKLNSMKKC